MPTDKPLELWAGVECTVNRVGDKWFNQVRRSGHWDRATDLDLLAELGAKAVRYPVLWELVAPEGDLSRARWGWTDQRLAILRVLGMRPIAGLLHHGSGPVTTNLLDPAFPAKLEAYALAVARRYPWIEDYTPVNEPLTTARFSALYGHWYPHRKDYASFSRALINECLGTVAAMRAIRSVNPRARLIQTEDFGTVTSTPRLAHQARFENDRRWLTLDLLFGRVDAAHPMRQMLLEGVSSAELDALVENPCPPDIIGLNHYITSDRWLDERLELYPPQYHGGNGVERYADIEAVRVPDSGVMGHQAVLEEGWRRYGKPTALTEVHIDSVREDQLRWFKEAWTGAQAAREGGADVRAVTAWAVLGSFDWNCLLTRDAGYYESGAFDLRNPTRQPRATAVARMIGALGRGEPYEHPLLTEPGWWRRPCRTIGGPLHAVYGEGACEPFKAESRPLLVTGGGGTLGAAFARFCASRAIRCVTLRRADLDAADLAAVEAAIDRWNPWAVINAAGYVRVDEAERHEERCRRENVTAAVAIATACARRGLPMLTFSSDLVFGGGKRAPYVETDSPRPLNVYGRSKAEAESLVLAACPGALVVRTSAFFGPWDQGNFVARALASWQLGQPFEADDRQTITPTWVPDLVRFCLDLLIDGETGLWHLACSEAVTWRQLAEKLADLTGHSRELIVLPNSARASAPRPPYSALGSARGSFLPPLDDCLRRLVERRPSGPARA